ncbi:MAG: adenylate/guanylate cyclase domain-containing protein [Cyanobacteria bacterium P01_E01_bin.42]
MSYFLVCSPDSQNEKIYKLKWGTNTIGRSQNNSISIKDNSLSRHHAEITIARDRSILKDLNSLNGTFVDRKQIQQHPLKHGDVISCGTIVFKFLDAFAETEDNLGTSEELPIVSQFSPKKTQIAIEDILDRSKSTSSALQLKQQDANRRDVDKLKILLEVSKQLSSPESLDELLDKILDLLLKIMNVDRAAILLVNDKTRKLEQKAVCSRSGLSVNYQFYSTKIVNYVCKRGTAILTDDAGADRRFQGSDSILIQAIRASMCVPLQNGEEVFGVLYVDNLSRSKIYTEEDLEFLSALGTQAAIAIDNSRLTEKMQQEAIWRDKMERFFPKAISRKLREEGHLGIIDTEVTALFADISDFTKMSSTMKPRQVIEMLNDYFNVVVEEIIFAHEGTLEKYIGDALLAVWGAPYARPDDSDRAVQAAIDMQYAVRRLNREWQAKGRQPIAIHIGLNTGKVAAGNIGSERLIQYAAIGDTTNVTSRICNVAKANEIVLSHSTYYKLKNRDELPLEQLPLVRVKGKEKPLQLYRLHWQKISLDKTHPS